MHSHSHLFCVIPSLSYLFPLSYSSFMHSHSHLFCVIPSLPYLFSFTFSNLIHFLSYVFPFFSLLSYTLLHIYSLFFLLLFAEQTALQEIILSQLENIEKKADTIIFFNEPISNFEETHYPFIFPYDALKQCVSNIDELFR